MNRVEAAAVRLLAIALDECAKAGVSISPPEDAMETTLIEGADFSYFLPKIDGNTIRELLDAYGRLGEKP